ncbi:MAG: CvpA family protein [Firmicutes bacterium]|nr:CvpA family protein [Bacillota bacterium]
MNLLDWVIAVGLAIGAIRGFRRGLVRSAAGLLGLFLGLILASRLYESLARYVEARYGLVTRLAGSLAEHLPLAEPVGSAPAAGGQLVDAIRGLGLPESVCRYLSDAAARLGLGPGATVAEGVALVIAWSIVGILAFVAIFIVVQILATFLGGVVRGIIRLTPLSLLDHLGGLVVGAAWAAVGMAVTVGLLEVASSIPALAFARPLLDGSVLAPSLSAVFRVLLPRVPALFGRI